MKEDIKNWISCYTLKVSDLYIKFPFKKYLTIYNDFEYTELKELCGRILRQMFFYAIEDIIENNVTLKFPPGSNAWLELQAYSGEDFKRARLNGAFQDVDFLASDFTGYQMVLRFQNRYGKWQKRMYLSARHRDRITYLTNLGKLLTSARIKLVKDYVERLQLKFPILSKSEINKICTFGLKRFAYANRQHCDILICNRGEDILTARCGRIYLDEERFWRNWYMKYRMKERFMYHLKKIPWDGYYYIGLTTKEHLKILNLKGKKHFENIYPVKVLKELYHERWCDYIWRVPYPIDCGWKFFRENLVTDKAEYVEVNQYSKIHSNYKLKNASDT